MKMKRVRQAVPLQPARQSQRDFVRRRGDHGCEYCLLHVRAMNDARRLELRSALLAHNQP